MGHDFPNDIPFKKKLVVNAIKGAIKKNPTAIETRTVDELVFGGYTAPIFEALKSMKSLMEQMGIHKEIPERMAILFDVSRLVILFLS